MVKPGPGVSEQDLEPLAALFKLLSDGTRLKILMILSAGERNVGSLCAELQLPQPTVSHHLGLLRMRGLIANRRAGKQVFYGLDSVHMSRSDTGLVIHAGAFNVRIDPPGPPEMA